MIDSLPERIQAKIWPEPMSGCWLWGGALRSTGYGSVYLDGSRSAHRVVWEAVNGPIPKGTGHHGTCVLHRCDNRACVNPDHLFLGSHQDNVADMHAKGRGYQNPGKPGETNHMAKLTDAEVVEMRLSQAAGDTQMVLAKRYGVSQGLVSAIIRRERWTHV
jgi:hypothetical protein